MEAFNKKDFFWDFLREKMFLPEYRDLSFSEVKRKLQKDIIEMALC